MASSKPCRNFMFGSCHYGDRCKFLHSAQPQIKQDIFGISSQRDLKSQDTQHDHTSAGVEIKNHHKNSQFKLFSNTWTRDAPAASSLLPSASGNGKQEHTFGDPDRPGWALTCYGHQGSSPCDIVGDMSYEELRYAAYGDVKSGASVQSIIERERNLFSLKKDEFDRFLAKSDGGGDLSVGGSPLCVSSFSQLGLSSNAPTHPQFGRIPATQASALPSHAFPGSQLGGFSVNATSSPASLSLSGSVIGGQVSAPTPVSVSTSTSQALTTREVPGLISMGRAESIWMKEEWSIGEIPEEAPPDDVIVRL